MGKNVFANLKIICLFLLVFFTGCGGSGGPPPPPPPPLFDAPTNLMASVLSSSSIRLTWIDNSNNETGFKIERSTSETSGFTQLDTVGPDVDTYVSIGLTTNTTYYFRVCSFNSDGNSDYSNVVGIKIPDDVPPPVNLIAPSGLTATKVGDNIIRLDWVDNSNNETGFWFEDSTSSTQGFLWCGQTNQPNKTYFMLGSYNEGTYYFRMCAFNGNGNSAYSNVASVTIPVFTPAAPSLVTATAISSSEIHLTWHDNSHNETEFRIYCYVGTANIALVGTVGANVTSFDHSGLPSNTNCSYYVRAYNSAGESLLSNSHSATTLGP